MPAMRKAPERFYSKVITTKQYGFQTPQNGSVCKIKIISDEAKIVDGLDESSSKDIVVGNVDEPVDMIIEDCIRTMKEIEECSIEFLHSDLGSENVDSSGDGKNTSNLPVDTKPAAENNPSVDDHSRTEATPVDEIDSDKSGQKVDISYPKTGKINDDSSNNNSLHVMVKIQFQLLSFTREPEIWEMSQTEKWRRARSHKQNGLELYDRGLYQYAFRRFGLALKYAISLEQEGQEDSMDIKGLKFSCYLNVAACQMKNYNFDSVVINSSKALNLQPNNVKALYRRGAAYIQLQEYEKAEEDLATAQQLEPKNQAIVRQLQILSCPETK